MTEFIRSEETQLKMVLDAFEGEVLTDVKVSFYYQGGKLKAYCENTKTNLQFPTKLRNMYVKYVCDVVKCQRSNGKIFYRAYKGSIRDVDGNVVG